MANGESPEAVEVVVVEAVRPVLVPVVDEVVIFEGGRSRVEGTVVIVPAVRACECDSGELYIASSNLRSLGWMSAGGDMTRLAHILTFPSPVLPVDTASNISKNLTPQQARDAANAAAEKAKGLTHPDSNYPFYSQTLARSLGARTPMAQYMLYATVIGGLGFTGRQFYRSHHLLQATKFKPQTKEYLHHLKQAAATETEAADAVKVAE
ncbi:hypothetical protein HK101_010059, partial [Irineochytrium annulatum]